MALSRQRRGDDEPAADLERVLSSLYGKAGDVCMQIACNLDQIGAEPLLTQAAGADSWNAAVLAQYSCLAMLNLNQHFYLLPTSF
jgi:hypothetical protein